MVLLSLGNVSYEAIISQYIDSKIMESTAIFKHL